MPTSLEIENFLLQSKGKPVIDVRSPAEYEQGHIPGVINLPLFNNEERAIIGTLYKHKGRQEAIYKGYEIFGPKMTWFIDEFKKKYPEFNPGDEIFVHCWRGGMRSGAIAWLFEMWGFKVYTLQKGYKAFRNWVLKEFEKERKLIVLGGKTGSGKTFVLQQLKNNYPVIDLENLAHHKGSSFGAIGELPQPSQEHFENKLAIQLHQYLGEKFILIEDESRMIGHRVIPEKLFQQIRSGEVFYLEIPFEERAKFIAQEYGKYAKKDLFAATERIIKKLDSRYAKDALQFIEEGNYLESFKISLRYYDKTYDFGLSQRELKSIVSIPVEKVDIEKMTLAIEKLLHGKN